MTNSAPAATALRTLARETDTELARLDDTYASLTAEYKRLVGRLHRLAGDTRSWAREGRKSVQVWALSDEAVVAGIRAGRFEIRTYDIAELVDVIAAYTVVEAAIPANRASAEALEDIHAAHDWSRFFVVRNTGGHIHYDQSSYRCSRTMTTSHGWNPELSGATEAEAVAALGPIMCTVCFPSAPVEWTVGHAKPARCAGSGTYVRSDRSRYATCGTCGESVAKNPNTFRLRAHKPKV